MEGGQGQNDKRMAPKFVDLARAYSEIIEVDALHWTKDKVWEEVEAQCEIHRINPGELVTIDSISRTMVYWFAVATEGHIKVNMPPLRPWKAPLWLTRDGEETDSLLRDHTSHLCLRLNHVIDEELDLAAIQRATSRCDVVGGQARKPVRSAESRTQGIDEGRMKYPGDFPPESRARVEAEKIRAGREFDSAKQAARWTSDVEALVRHYILRIFLVFANEACALRLWPVEKMDLNCREFLRLLTIAAHSEKGYDRGGGRLRDMNSNWNGAILPEVEREFEKTTEWQRYQDALLESAEAQIAKETKLINNPQREQILSNPGNAPITLSSKCGVDAAGAEPEDHSAESPDLWSAVCAVCGHYQIHHDSAGCFLDPQGRNSQDPGILSRSALKKTGALCWCPKFIADFSRAADLIYESGNLEALKHGAEEAITRGDPGSARRLLDQLIIKTPPAVRDLDWIKAVERSIAAVKPAALVPESADNKPGRALARSPDFVNFAGRLWLTAKGQSGNANVKAEQLRQIASGLDERQYIPPAEYLEGDCARELKAFNSRNSNSKKGPIQTWSQLITFGDKDHLRGMRRLLSRCAQKQPL